jgi:hypothetical protein
VTRPALRIVGGGEPTDEELAALVAVVSMLQARQDADAEATGDDRWRLSARAARPWRRQAWLTFSRRTSLRAGE